MEYPMMTSASTMLDYVGWLDEGTVVPPGAFRTLLQAFAALPSYRSAMVDELVLDRDFCRRALRPDDLAFIDFSRPIDAESSSSLGALAANRLLLCANESTRVVVPPDRSDRRWAEFRHFYSTRNRALAGLVAPLLERHALGYLIPPSNPEAVLGRRRLLEAIERELARGTGADTSARFIARSAPAVRDLRRFTLLQFLPFAPTRLSVLDAVVDGWLAAIEPSARQVLARVERPQVGLAAAGELLELPLERHACWQFYLPRTLALANVLHMLARGPRPFRGLGALLFIALATGRFVREHGDVADALGVVGVADVASAADAIVDPVARLYGDDAWDEAAVGFETCARAQEEADRDLGTQLAWLTRVDEFQHVARIIHDRIEHEPVQIKRDTFVEPREMCSTTHVHDDFRLVVVESGEMVFWGMPHMRLVLPAGDMMLVPRHRLHGSSVLTDVCVYHQPIIPESWLAAYDDVLGYVVSVS
jgi:hypothetical protein